MPRGFTGLALQVFLPHQYRLSIDPDAEALAEKPAPP